MKTLNKSTAKILDAMVANLTAPGSESAARTIDNTDGVFMAVHVERISAQCYSIAHYYEQNGDLVPDPDLVVWRAETGDFLPISLQQCIGRMTVAVNLENDQPVSFAPKLCKELASFANMMIRNIKSQQGGIAALRS